MFQLRAHMPREVGCVYWRTTAEPSISVLTPWYVGITETPKCYYRPTHIQTQLSLDHHFSPPPDAFTADPDLAWWKFFTLQEIVHENYENRVNVVRAVWETFENGEFSEQQAFEERVLRSLKTDEMAAYASLTQYCADTALRACQEADRLIGGLRKAKPERK